MTTRSSRISVVFLLTLVAGLNRGCKSDAGTLGPKGGPLGAAGAAGMGGQPQGNPGLGGFSSSGGAPTNALPEAPRREPEVPGTSLVTFLHGVVDAPRIGLCFAKTGAAGLVSLSDRPWPMGGLAFGESQGIKAPSGFGVVAEALVAIVVAGDTSVLGRLTCSEALALLAAELPSGAGGSTSVAGAAGVSQAGQGNAGVSAQAGRGGQDAGQAGSGGQAAGQAGSPAQGVPEVRVRVLVALPPGTLTATTSYLLAATGCLGAPGFSDDRQQFVCGDGYTPKSSTLAPVLVALSRIAKFNAPGIQVLNASLGTPALSLYSDPALGSGKPRITLGVGLLYGELAPHPAYSSSAAQDYAATTTAYLNVNDATLLVTWKDILARAGLSDLEAAKTYSVVFVGPNPSLPKPSWWNPPTLSLLLNDPPVSPAP